MNDHRHSETCWVGWQSNPICDDKDTYVQRSEAELADLRASSVVFKVRCDLGVTDNARGEWVHRDDCPYGCDNGWQLAEGVESWQSRYGDKERYYVIPARMIDGEDT